MNSLDVLTNADQLCRQSVIIQYTEKKPALGETDLQAKPEEHGAVLISSVILCYLSRCRSVLSGHNTTRDTRRHFQRAQGCIMSADYTANTGWQPKHDT
jgi:hypothetical protein